MFKRLIIIGVLLIIVMFFGYNYLYQEHRNIAEETPAYVLKATELENSFIEVPEIAGKKYLNKTIAIKGKVTTLNRNSLILDNIVFCEFAMLPTNIQLNETIVIKGRCIGYDDLLGEVKFDQCSYLSEY